MDDQTTGDKPPNGQDGCRNGDTTALLQAVMEKKRALQQQAPTPVGELANRLQLRAKTDDRTQEQKDFDADAQRQLEERQKIAKAKWDEEQAKLREESQKRQRNFYLRTFMRQVGSEYDCRPDSFTLFGPPEIQQRQQAVLNSVRDFGRNLFDNIHDGKNVLFFGTMGTGKDHLMKCLLAAAILKHGFSVDWRNGAQLWIDLRDTLRKHSEVSERQLLRELGQADILAISDVLPPSGTLTEFQATALFAVIDERYRHQRPTFMTLNVASRQEAENRMGAQIVDRLAQRALVQHFAWPSWREHSRKLAVEVKP